MKNAASLAAVRSTLLIVLALTTPLLLRGEGSLTGAPPDGERLPILMASEPGEEYPPAAVEQERAWKEKRSRPRYARAEWWPHEMGPRHFGHVALADLDAPDTLILPGNKGSFRSGTGRGAPEIAAGLRKSLHGPSRSRGEYLIAQLDPARIAGKVNGEIREAIAAVAPSIEILEYVPNNAFLLRVDGNGKDLVLASGLFRYVTPYHPAFKIEPGVGIGKVLSPRRAEETDLHLVIRLFPGESAGEVEREIRDAGGRVEFKRVLEGGETVLAATVDRMKVFDLANLDEVKLIQEKRDLEDLTLVTSIQTEMGRLLDPRIEGRILRPFTDEGIDGGGLYVTDPNQIAGCVPFDAAAGNLDPDCYIIPPQFVGLVDNGITLDAAPLAHSRTLPCAGSATDCSRLAEGIGVGPEHRKVEMYVTSRDLNHDGVPEDPTAEGDFLSCDAIDSGGDTHGHIVAATMLGNPSDGPIGLGFHFSDVDASNQFPAYFNDTNEREFPMDGQARGARLLMIDAQGNGVAVLGPPPCATNYLSDVEAGALVVDDVQALACRNDVDPNEDCIPSPDDPNETWFRRGARDIVLPFGAPVDFDDNIYNGQGTYAGHATDLDRFLFSHRRVLISVPVGNDGADQTGADIDPFRPLGDPNDTFTADDIQIQDLATGKNIVSVGSNGTDTLRRDFMPTDPTEFMSNFTSKGPATYTSRRIAPLLAAPGFEAAKSGGGREGESSDDYFDSHAVITSFDDDQSPDHGIERVRNQKKSGTSLAAAKIAGAAAQIRDYFAKGYYPGGLANHPDDSRQDISGSLVKAILVASTDFLQSGPLILNCQNKFCIEQGYGKVELANVLPLKSYPATRRPADLSNLSNQPDVPNNILVADELFDGGRGYGVVALGQAREVKFVVTHGGASVRAALAWYDAPGELLVNDLNLEVIDGDYDFTPAYNGSALAALGTGGADPQCTAVIANAGACNWPGNRCDSAVGTGNDYTGYGCGYCRISALPNPDAAWFDPNNGNPYVRRYLGNVFRDRQQFSKKADCNPATGALNTGSPNSLADTRNTTEMVYLYHTTDQSNVVFVAANQGTGSEGPYKAVVSWRDSGTGREKAAPNTPCVFDVDGDGIDGAVGATDRLLRTRDGRAYIGSGVDDPNTAGTDEAACNSTAAWDDLQVCPNGAKCQPFGLVVTGPIDYGAGNARAQVELDKQAYDCSDTSLRMTVTEDEPSGVTITTKVSNASRIEVLDAAGNVVDSEAGIGFSPINTLSANFRVWRRMANVSNAVRVQSIGDPGRGPILNNGVVEVQDGRTIRAVYEDPDGGDPAVIATAKVVCEFPIGEAYIARPLDVARQRIVAGGCDAGRYQGAMGDPYLDAGERVQYQVYFTNHSREEIRDLTATLTCLNPAGTTEDPCGHVGILDAAQRIGRVPFGREGAAVWNLEIDPGVRSLSTSNRIVDFEVSFSTPNRDFGADPDSRSFTFREALEADEERFFYSTDHPGGGTAFVDLDRDGLIAPVSTRATSPRTERESRTYESWAGTANAGLLSACGGSPCVPFHFDLNDGGFTSRLSADSKPDAGFPLSTQGWFWGTGGGCGWQTRSGAAKGIWHAGAGPIGAFGSGCGTYAIPSDAGTLPLTEFTNFLLTSPVFNKVHPGTDARGFAFDVRMESLSWNENQEIADSRTRVEIEIDSNIDDDGPVILGDSFSYIPLYAPAPGPYMTSLQGARRFGPRFDPDRSLPVETGEEIGVSSPLTEYPRGMIGLAPYMPYPVADADPNDAAFTEDTRVSTGAGGPCPAVPAGRPCRTPGFTTAAGPVRNRDVDTGASYEDFWGASGDRFQLEMNWVVGEGGQPATGWTLDDLVLDWSEGHPADPMAFTGGDCSLDNLAGLSCSAGTCAGGPRHGLSCSTVADCREVVVEGACVASLCTAGRVGLPCANHNQCDLGRCVVGNTALGCAADADCDLSTNACEAIPFRIAATGTGGVAAASRPCAILNMDRIFTYDCTGAFQITLRDETPDLCGPGAGCSTAPRQVIVNARSAAEPAGEDVILTETAPGSDVFTGDVSASAVTDVRGVLFVAGGGAVPAPVITVSYHDPECDLDADAQTGETDFLDSDGDGVPSYGADGVLKDQDPILTFCASPAGGCAPGAPVSDDDNCFNSMTASDVFNPAGAAQMDLNGDGMISASDCVVDPNHNRSGQCDFDSDGLGDICDNCPKTANSNQLDTDADGIGNECEDIDIDRDGVGNASDNCPTVYNPSQSEHGGGKSGGRGEVCDEIPVSTADYDLDGIGNLTDNCPNEGIMESGTGHMEPGPCPGGGRSCTYNPDQLDNDQDGIGDVCDSEDLDRDGVTDVKDNCPTIYNPADPVFFVQTDSDGDGRGDDRRGEDGVGRCAGGPAPGSLCVGVGTGSTCGAGGFCVPSPDAYCDPDSMDDDADGVADDLLSFTTEIDCSYAPGGFGAKAAEVSAVQFKTLPFGASAAVLSDDGTADFVCVSGAPDPNNPVLPQDCPDRDPAHRAASIGVTGTAADLSCQTPGSPVPTPDCEIVPDGFPDPGERVGVRITLTNQTTTATNAPRSLTNVTIGLRATTSAIGCVTKGQVFVGTFAGGATLTTPAGALEFILSPATGQSVPEKFAEAGFVVTVQADGIEANSPDQTFTAIADRDFNLLDLLTDGCGVGGALGAAHNVPGALCEDFDTERNGTAGYQWTRLFSAADPNDPLLALPDPNDDILGSSVDGGPIPLGVDGQGPCSSDPGSAPALTCHVVPTENDWHLHSPFEPCGASYDNIGLFPSSCAPAATSHSGFRSMHMGRHLNATDSFYDTYRLRQTSAFVMDPVNLGSQSVLDFWHIISVCDDKCVSAGSGGTTAGGQVQISLRNLASGKYERWRRLSPTQNGYNSVDQEVIIICEFDPGDDQHAPLDETMCGSQPQWSDIGDVYGYDRTCTVDTDHNDPVDRDCGSTTNRTALTSCAWVTDPNCGSFLENGLPQNRGVWARSRFDLSSFTGRTARLRWIFEGGGGWGFGTSRSFIEPESGSPYFAFDQDDGWYIDDIRITDVRSRPADIRPDPDDGLAACPSQGDTANCGAITLIVTGSATDARTGRTVLWAPSGVAGTAVALDARQSVAGDDPATPAAEQGCVSGVLEYQWSRVLSGGGVEVIEPFSPRGVATVFPLGDEVFRVEARCSSDPACAAARDVDVLVYTGDGGDLNTTLDASGAPIDGLTIDHNLLTEQATLTWRSRPQPPGVSGYDLFRSTQTSIGAVSLDGAGDLFANDRFQGTCLVNAVPATAAGTLVTRTDVTSTLPAGQAFLYMLSHSSNYAAAVAPLGRRPSASNRAGTLVSANVTCP